MKKHTIITTVLLAAAIACTTKSTPQCEGDFTIRGANAQNQLAALSKCTCISGNLSIRNTDLTDLEALSSLKWIGGNLWIDTNDSLTALDGLDALVSVGGEFSVSGNASLTTLEGLRSLTSIGHDLWLFDNPRLQSLDGLAGLRSVGGQVSIRDNGFPATVKTINEAGRMPKARKMKKVEQRKPIAS